MAVPDFQAMMLPLLKFAGDGQEHSMAETIDQIAQVLNLSDTDRNELLPSGQQRRFDNRIGWARSHLTKAGLLETTRTSHFRITQSGLDVLAKKLPKIDLIFLDQYPGHLEFRKRSKGVAPQVASSDDNIQSPKEAIEYYYQKLREDLSQQLLEAVLQQSPTFFERLVVDLLVAMGYGGSRADAGKAIGKSGDEGIDGMIDEDKLGLDKIYVQAKRWGSGAVGSPEIQKFVGALTKKNAKKGVFITTSTFTADARDFVRNLPYNVALIDGRELAQLMIDYNVGVNKDAIYEIKRIDSDFFSGT